MAAPRAVRFDRYGDREVLTVRSIEVPQPGPGEVVVEVRAAGTNPGEVAIREGAMAESFPATFPSGQGSDLAGVVSAVGDGASWSVGDEVLGWSWNRDSQATHVAVPADQLIAKPSDLPWDVAGSLYVAGVTAVAAVQAVAPAAGETVVVSAAAGGVGSVVTQILVGRGISVIGIASEGNAEWLRERGATPVPYGPGLVDRVRDATPNGVDAVIDLFGPEYIDLALDLGVTPARIETIISFERAGEVGAQARGSMDITSRESLTEAADLVVNGTVQWEIAARYPLDDVVAAYARLEERHTRGKIVLVA